MSETQPAEIKVTLNCQYLDRGDIYSVTLTSPSPETFAVGDQITFAVSEVTRRVTETAAPTPQDAPLPAVPPVATPRSRASFVAPAFCLAGTMVGAGALVWNVTR